MLPRTLLALATAGVLTGSGDAWLPRYDLSRAAEVHGLPRALDEASGLAIDPSGRLFTHHDETSAVYELDPGTGRVVKRFHAARRGIRGDFEGLALAEGRFFLVSSDGILLEFREAGGDEVAPAREVRTGLGGLCEVEGLAYHPATSSLLLPCKTPRRRELRERLVVFAVPLATLVPDPEPRVSLPLRDLERLGLGRDFHPSAIDVHPSGNLFLVAAREEAIVELSPRGAPLSASRLPRRLHPQAEGLAFGPDSTLWIVDEGGGGRGRLSRHPPRPAADEAPADAPTRLGARAGRGGP